MNIYEYVEFLPKTIQYPEDSEYLSFGITSELLELYIHINTEEMNDQVRSKAIKKELGDIFYFICQLAVKFEFMSIQDLLLGVNDYTFEDGIISTNTLIHYTEQFNSLKAKYIRQDPELNFPEEMKKLLCDLYSFLMHLSTAYLPRETVNDILWANKLKLEDRLERNVIKGNGDDR